MLLIFCVLVGAIGVLAVLEPESRGVKKYSIPYVGQFIPIYVPV